MRVFLEEHVTDLPRRLREIDADLRVSFNPTTQQYEIWDMKYEYEPFLMAVFDYLDQRVEDAIRKGYADTHNLGWRGLDRMIDEHNAKIEAQHEKENADMAYGLASDLRYAGREVYRGW